MKLMASLGSESNAQLQVLVIIFKNDSCSYSIRRTAENLSGD